uniref:Uncharacterized protein n=1 Tax=Arundo donax TaxID=35708 RepID=A0A0A9A459_ARUDO
MPVILRVDSFVNQPSSSWT